MVKPVTFAEYRAERGLTLEQCALELKLAPSSRGWLSEIENGLKDASLRLALRIERWSGGRVPAASVNREIRDTEGSGHGGAVSVDDPTVLAPSAPLGAGAKIEIVQ